MNWCEIPLDASRCAEEARLRLQAAELAGAAPETISWMRTYAEGAARWALEQAREKANQTKIK